MVAFTHDQPSTPETRWLQSPGIAAMFPLEIDWSAVSTLVVVAAHPDDETLGAAGLLKRAASHGVPIEILVATWGEKSHPGSPTHSAAELSGLRAGELRAALGILAPSSRHRVLGMPDGEVQFHAHALESEIAAAAGVDGTALIVAPWSADGHTDHEAAGSAAARAARSTHSLFLEYPVWMWHWVDPGTDGQHQEQVPWPALRKLELDANEQSVKDAAIASHTTQVQALSPAAGDEALLSEQMLSHFQRSFETLLDVAGQFTPMGRDGAAWLQQQFDAVHADGAEPWDPPSWYEQRKRALLLAGLPRKQYRSGFELGCSTGALTEVLAPRCQQLVGMDASKEAVETARRRTTGHASVTCLHGVLPQDWPPGRFDLFVLSESGYYFSEEGLTDLMDRMEASALPDAHLVACHWRHPISGWPLDGGAVHHLLRADSRLILRASYTEDDFLLDFFRLAEPS